MRSPIWSEVIRAINEPLPVELYKVYERALKAALGKVRKHQADFKYGIQPLAPWLIRRFIQKYFPSSLKSALKRFVHT